MGECPWTKTRIRAAKRPLAGGLFYVRGRDLSVRTAYIDSGLFQAFKKPAQKTTIFGFCSLSDFRRSESPYSASHISNLPNVSSDPNREFLGPFPGPEGASFCPVAHCPPLWGCLALHTGMTNSLEVVSVRHALISKSVFVVSKNWFERLACL